MSYQFAVTAPYVLQRRPKAYKETVTENAVFEDYYKVNLSDDACDRKFNT